MGSVATFDAFVQRLTAAVRGSALYTPHHPIVRRSVATLAAVSTAALNGADALVMGVIGDTIVVNGERLRTASAAGFARELRDDGIEKITFERGVTPAEIETFVFELAVRNAPAPLATRLEQKGVRRINIGRLNIDDSDEPTGIPAARRVYTSAVDTAHGLWDQARAGDQPDPDAARKIIDSLARLVSQDRTSLMALTALKRYDDYTFTHMVNVSVLAMALARSLGVQGVLLREFGFAALMHDIGKVRTPVEVLNKPDKLTAEEFAAMKQHVIDGAHILRRTPGMPALAAVVAFEHHLRQDLSGYPEGIGHRDLNLCTQVVSIVDVYDALRSNRIYREGLPSERIRAIMTQKDSPAFNTGLLRRFINLMGLFPVGTLVRLSTDEVGVVTHEHPGDPFRPQVKRLLDRDGERLEAGTLVNTWEPDARGQQSVGVIEAVDPDSVGLDPLAFL